MLGFVMVLAVVGKVHSPAEFRAFVGSLDGFGWIPRSARPAVAVAVVVAEAASAALLGFPATATAGYLLALTTVGAFTAAVLIARARGRQVRCRCFGADGGPMGTAHLIRNAALLAVAAAGLAAHVMSAQSRSEAGPLAVAVVLGVLAAIGLTYSDELRYLFGPRPARHSHH